MLEAGMLTRVWQSLRLPGQPAANSCSAEHDTELTEWLENTTGQWRSAQAASILGTGQTTSAVD